MPDTDISYYPDAIVTRSRGLLEFLSFGRWGTTTTLDFAKRTVTVESRWPWKASEHAHRFTDFHGVDYSYEEISSSYRNSVERETGKFRVGLCFGNNDEVLPVANFKGTSSTAHGLAEMISNWLPESWSDEGIRHEIASRTFANMLCEKMRLRIEI